MIGRLPTSLNIDGKEYKIRTDYRDCLLIFQAFNDVELTDYDKMQVTVQVLYENIPDNFEEAYSKAVWFLDCDDTVNKPHSKKPLYDFEQDEQMIFSAINKVANKEIRSVEYMHWWTFMGYFNEIGECQFSTVVSIRDKKQKGKKLEKWEQEYYRNNKETIELKRKHTAQEQAELDALDAYLSS